MKSLVPEEVEKGRHRAGLWGTDWADGFNGAFTIRAPFGRLRVISSVELDWEHVSVSLPNRCPTWEEMDFVKRLFWDDDEIVCQFHVNNEDKVNFHPYCLHMWKPTAATMPTPPSWMVGPTKKREGL